MRGGALTGGEYSIFKDKEAPKSVACLGSYEQLRKAESSGRLRHRSLSWPLVIGCYSLTAGSNGIYKISVYVGSITVGVFKQGRESDFCFGKENSGPGSEQLLCQTQRRL